MSEPGRSEANLAVLGTRTVLGPDAPLRFEWMSDTLLDQVAAIEPTAYDHPWSRGNFADSVRAGYQCQVLMSDDLVLGYFVAMLGADEVHLLNITVTPAFQGQGFAQCMLRALVLWSRQQSAQALWLEVRVSNTRALRLYERQGFRRVAERKGYYPNGPGAREDAVIMNLPL